MIVYAPLFDEWNTTNLSDMLFDWNHNCLARSATAAIALMKQYEGPDDTYEGYPFRIERMP